MTEEPSLLKKGINLSQYTWELMKYVTENPGKALVVSDDVFDKRIDVCRECEAFDVRKFQCNECGCPLSQKARMILDACPLDKWDIDDSDWETRFNDIKEGIDNELEEE